MAGWVWEVSWRGEEEERGGEQLVALASDGARARLWVRGLAGRGMADASLVYVQRMEGARDKFRSAQILEVRVVSTAVDARGAA